MLPATERMLLGPGPSLISPRVMRAMAAPMLSHLDAQFLAIMDDLRARLARVSRAPEGSLALAVSGTGTSAMEAAVANLVQPGSRVLAIVTGYSATGSPRCAGATEPTCGGSTWNGAGPAIPTPCAGLSPNRQPTS